MARNLNVVDRDLWGIVQNLDLPLVLVDLSDFTVAFATPAFLSQVDVPASGVLNLPIYELFNSPDRENAREALENLAAGRIDYFRSHRSLKRPTKTKRAVAVWVCAVDVSDRQYALAEFSNRLDALDSPLSQYLGFTPLEKAVGIVDADGIITSVSTNVETVLGVPAKKLIGQHLVQSVEGRRIYHELSATASTTSVAMPLATLNHFGGTLNVRCILTPLATSSDHCFLLIADDSSDRGERADRAAQLEHRLWRIASEVQASGIFDSLGTLPDASSVPELNSLSTREWEVLSRLQRGERVTTIADALYVSPSTVRNNLSSIFKKFRVHSQAELLQRLLS